MVYKFCGEAQFPHSFRTRKLGEITVFYVVATFNVELLFVNILPQEFIVLCVVILFQGKTSIDGLTRKFLRNYPL